MKDSQKEKSQGKTLEVIKKHLNSFDTQLLNSDFAMVENYENTVREIDLVVKLTRIEPYDDVLDLCCGHGRHTEELCRRDFRSVVGVDRSRITIRMARKHFLERGLKGGRFSQGDARSLKFSDERFDCILMLGNSLGSFDKEKDEEKVFKELFRVVKEHGHVVIDVTDGEWVKHNFQPKSFGWTEQKLFVCKERHLAPDGRRLISREVVIDPQKGSVAEEFYAERLFSTDELTTLLVKHGFVDVLKRAFKKMPFSNRRDFLAFENRLLFTARKPKKRFFFMDKRGAPLPILALLSDPKFYDPLVEQCLTQAQEFDSLKQLKEALDSLHQFSFSYFDNHEHFMKEIMKNRPHFVFNLCKEGLFNDGDKELHIPALLDTLAIPYSGSDPASIALCYDKAHLRSLANAADILVPDENWIAFNSSSITLPKQFPALVKPALKMSSQNILVKNVRRLRRAVEMLSEKKIPILIQEFLPGIEYSVGVFGNGDARLHAFPILEIGCPLLEAIPKWIKSTLPNEEQKKLVNDAFTLFRRLRCRDYALFNFRQDAHGNIKLLSACATPSLFPEGKFAKMAHFAQLTYAEMLEKFLRIAVERNRLQLEE